MPGESHLPAGQSAETHPTQAAAGPGYEVRDTKVGAIVAFIVGLFAVLTVTQFAMWGLLNAISGGKPEPADPLSAPEVAVRQNEKLRRDEDAVLNSYGWADGKTRSGPVRIPIKNAIDLVSERGLPPVADRARTEVEVNSHSGVPAPAGKAAKDEPEPGRRGGSEKGATR